MVLPLSVWSTISVQRVECTAAHRLCQVLRGEEARRYSHHTDATRCLGHFFFDTSHRGRYDERVSSANVHCMCRVHAPKTELRVGLEP